MRAAPPVGQSPRPPPSPPMKQETHVGSVPWAVVYMLHVFVAASGSSRPKCLQSGAEDAPSVWCDAAGSDRDEPDGCRHPVPGGRADRSHRSAWTSLSAGTI